MALFVVSDELLQLENQSIKENLSRIVGQIFKLLPTREEDKDWEKPLDTLLIEVSGLTLFIPGQPKLISLISKLAGIKKHPEDFDLFRRTIFEACGLANDLKDLVEP